MFKVAGALTCERAKNIQGEKESFKIESFVAVLRGASVFLWLPSMRLVRVPGCRASVSPSHTSCVSFVTEAHYSSPMGEYSFHCALKDHNLEMLRVKNNLLSCMLNETCLLLTSEPTKNKPRLTKKGEKPLSRSDLYLSLPLLSVGRKTRQVFFPTKTCKYCACAFYLERVDRLKREATAGHEGSIYTLFRWKIEMLKIINPYSVKNKIRIKI